MLFNYDLGYRYTIDYDTPVPVAFRQLAEISYKAIKLLNFKNVNYIYLNFLG